MLERRYEEAAQLIEQDFPGAREKSPSAGGGDWQFLGWVVRSPAIRKEPGKPTSKARPDWNFASNRNRGTIQSPVCWVFARRGWETRRQH